MGRYDCTRSPSLEYSNALSYNGDLEIDNDKLDIIMAHRRSTQEEYLPVEEILSPYD